MRMQRGTISKKTSASGAVWVYRWQTTRASDGRRVEQARTLGLVSDIGSKSKAWAEVEKQGLNKGINQLPCGTVTVKELAEHYIKNELESGVSISPKAAETVARECHYLRNYVIPRWGDLPAINLDPLDIEAWFMALTKTRRGPKNKPLLWPTVNLIKSAMSLAFQHGQRWKLLPREMANPLASARCHTLSDYEARIATPEQVFAILAELDAPETRCEWAMVLLHATTGLRAEEGFGLQWRDIDWEHGLIHLRRAWSKGKPTPGKTKTAMKPVPLHPVLAEGLMKWREESTYTKPTDWVFASVQAKGRVPRAASTAGKDYLRPAAIKAGVISKDENVRWGWHNLRHGVASVVTRTMDLSTAQKLLRHTKQSTTEKYTHRVSQELLDAQGELIAALKPKSEAVQ